uniref:mitogen-activated protein kinase kinase n=1 Tax=Acrobeloides nanus TaxID=290746 RepID=A0A914CNR7_9BILA
MENSLTNSTVGTIAYWAPERLEKEEKPFYNNRADVWSLGITLAEIVTGIRPYKNSKNEEITNIIQLQALIKNLSSEDLIKTFPKEYSEEARDFVKTCLIKDVRDRPDFDILQEHSFYTSRKSTREKRNQTVKWYFNNYEEYLNINGAIKSSVTSTSDSGFYDKSKACEKLETRISNAMAHINNTNLYDKEEINRRIQEVQKVDSEHDYSLTNRFIDNILKLPRDNKISTNLISNRFRPTIFHGFYDFLNLEQAKNIASFHGLEVLL